MLGEGAAMDSVALLRRGLLQHAPSCFNGKETGDDSRKPSNGRKRPEDCRQARGNHQPDERRAAPGGKPEPSRGCPHRDCAHTGGVELRGIETDGAMDAADEETSEG